MNTEKPDEININSSLEDTSTPNVYNSGINEASSNFDSFSNQSGFITNKFNQFLKSNDISRLNAISDSKIAFLIDAQTIIRMKPNQIDRMVNDLIELLYIPFEVHFNYRVFNFYDKYNPSISSTDSARYSSLFMKIKSKIYEYNTFNEVNQKNLKNFKNAFTKLTEWLLYAENENSKSTVTQEKKDVNFAVNENSCPIISDVGNSYKNNYEWANSVTQSSCNWKRSIPRVPINMLTIRKEIIKIAAVLDWNSFSLLSPIKLKKDNTNPNIKSPNSSFMSTSNGDIDLIKLSKSFLENNKISKNPSTLKLVIIVSSFPKTKLQFDLFCKKEVSDEEQFRRIFGKDISKRISGKQSCFNLIWLDVQYQNCLFNKPLVKTEPSNTIGSAIFSKVLAKYDGLFIPYTIIGDSLSGTHKNSLFKTFFNDIFPNCSRFNEMMIQCNGKIKNVDEIFDDIQVYKKQSIAFTGKMYYIEFFRRHYLYQDIQKMSIVSIIDKNIVLNVLKSLNLSTKSIFMIDHQYITLCHILSQMQCCLILISNNGKSQYLMSHMCQTTFYFSEINMHIFLQLIKCQRKKFCNYNQGTELFSANIFESFAKRLPSDSYKYFCKSLSSSVIKSKLQKYNKSIFILDKIRKNAFNEIEKKTKSKNTKTSVYSNRSNIIMDRAKLNLCRNENSNSTKTIKSPRRKNYFNFTTLTRTDFEIELDSNCDSFILLLQHGLNDMRVNTSQYVEDDDGIIKKFDETVNKVEKKLMDQYLSGNKERHVINFKIIKKIMHQYMTSCETNLKKLRHISDRNLFLIESKIQYLIICDKLVFTCHNSLDLDFKRIFAPLSYINCMVTRHYTSGKLNCFIMKIAKFYSCQNKNLMIQLLQYLDLNIPKFLLPNDKNDDSFHNNTHFNMINIPTITNVPDKKKLTKVYKRFSNCDTREIFLPKIKLKKSRNKEIENQFFMDSYISPVKNIVNFISPKKSQFTNIFLRKNKTPKKHHVLRTKYVADTPTKLKRKYSKLIIEDEDDVVIEESPLKHYDAKTNRRLSVIRSPKRKSIKCAASGFTPTKFYSLNHSNQNYKDESKTCESFNKMKTRLANHMSEFSSPVKLNESSKSMFNQVFQSNEENKPVRNIYKIPTFMDRMNEEYDEVVDQKEFEDKMGKINQNLKSTPKHSNRIMDVSPPQPDIYDDNAILNKRNDCENGKYHNIFKICICHQGYTGDDCKICGPNYYKVINGSKDLICKKCQCNRKSDQCHSTKSPYYMTIYDDKNNHIFKNQVYFNDSITRLIHKNIGNFQYKYWKVDKYFFNNLIAFNGGKISIYFDIPYDESNNLADNRYFVILETSYLVYGVFDINYASTNLIYSMNLQLIPNNFKSLTGEKITARQFSFILMNIKYMYFQVISSSVYEAKYIRVSQPDLGKIRVTCICPSGYIGNFCQICDSNYYQDCQNNICHCKICNYRHNCINCHLIKHRNYCNGCNSFLLNEKCLNDESEDISIIGPTVIDLNEGQDFNILCQSKYKIHPVWYLNSKKMISYKGNLKLVNVSNKDAGKYQCEIDEIAKIRKDVKIYVNEFTKPRIYLNQTNYYAAMEESIKIECLAKGNSEPFIFWERNKTMASSTKILKIKKFSILHSGAYTCHAHNQNGNMSKEIHIQLKINSYPTLTTNAILSENVELTILPNNVTVYEGNGVTLTCVVDKTYIKYVKWKKCDGYMPKKFSIDKNVLYLYNLKNQDSGKFSCFLKNLNLIKYSYSNVHVMKKKEFLQMELIKSQYFLNIGESVNIDCMVYGHPKPTVKWYKLENKSSSRSLLNLNNAKYQDSGNYICQSFNTYDSITKSIVIRVLEFKSMNFDSESNMKIQFIIKNSFDLHFKIKFLNLLQNVVILSVLSNEKAFVQNHVQLSLFDGLITLSFICGKGLGIVQNLKKVTTKDFTIININIMDNRAYMLINEAIFKGYAPGNCSFGQYKNSLLLFGYSNNINYMQLYEPLEVTGFTGCIMNRVILNKNNFNLKDYKTQNVNQCDSNCMCSIKQEYNNIFVELNHIRLPYNQNLCHFKDISCYNNGYLLKRVYPCHYNYKSTCQCKIGYGDQFCEKEILTHETHWKFNKFARIHFNDIQYLSSNDFIFEIINEMKNGILFLMQIFNVDNLDPKNQRYNLKNIIVYLKNSMLFIDYCYESKCSSLIHNDLLNYKIKQEFTIKISNNLSININGYVESSKIEILQNSPMSYLKGNLHLGGIVQDLENYALEYYQYMEWFKGCIINFTINDVHLKLKDSYLAENIKAC
ncbi:hypothetical protein A3Q56_03558 [Intoshia linei]|uniref:Ig-like domain-containing protein n=1 Tax=Intoshia linei TaxID=1819745 RepID=A0A177B378_9BILA|nr:hypothetical protein A3Q56_03558 [Intoshia linei]